VVGLGLASYGLVRRGRVRLGLVRPLRLVRVWWGPVGCGVARSGEVWKASCGEVRPLRSGGVRHGGVGNGTAWLGESRSGAVRLLRHGPVG